MENKKLLTAIPFAGFYNSYHEANLENELENMFSDDCGDKIEAIHEKIWDEYLVDWKACYEAYSKEYVEQMAHQYDIPSLVFESLESPREYNFKTDRIFCHIDSNDVIRLFQATDKKLLADTIKDSFTSYGGFMSHYSNDLEVWLADAEHDVTKWDHNQIETLLEAYFNQEQYDVTELVDHENCRDILENNIKDIGVLYDMQDEYLKNN